MTAAPPTGRGRGIRRASLVVLGMASALPAGWAVGTWVVFGDGDLALGLARHGMALPCGAVSIAATIAATRGARGLTAVLVPLMVVGMLLLGAWSGVSARIEAIRAGPLDAAM